MKTKALILYTVLICFTQASFASENKAVFLGHLLTPTTYTPQKKIITAGSHVLTYSISDSTMVGTSTFLALFYNSPNLFLKYGKQVNSKSRWALQFDYLKSTDTEIIRGDNFYEMEAFMLWGLWSTDINPVYTIHYSLNYMYFVNEGKPHSLRREPFNDHPFQFSFTTLHEVRITERYGIATEVGILGLNYATPNLHLGLTFRYTGKNFLVQAGLSIDNILWGEDKAALYAEANPILEESHTVNLLTHPEFGFQYFF